MIGGGLETSISSIYASAMLTCPSCGKESPDGFLFCPHCATRLGPPVPTREVRKTVTIVFCDVAGSTALGERLDSETLRRLMARYFEAMREAIEQHGGTVEKFIGDAVMAVFGIPQVHEDDALRALRAAADMRKAMDRLSKELERDHGMAFASRIGVNTGEVVAGDASSGQALVTGDAVNVAARLEQTAAPGDVLIGEATYRLARGSVDVEPVEPLTLKGKSKRLPAFRLIRVTDSLGERPQRMDSPMIGRRRELGALRTAYDRVSSDRACQLFTILAPAGTGKSRLAEEFVAEIAGATILRGRCLPYGDGITYFPILEIVKQAAGLADFDAPEIVADKVFRVLEGEEQQEVVCRRIGQLLGVDAIGSPEETFWAVRRFIEAIARKGPLVAILDDVHWAEPTLLDLVEHIADWSRDVPILLLCMARTELFDRRPAWGGGKLNASTISLESLSESECVELITNLLDATDVPSVVSERIASAAEGNPLFVEEMLAMLVDDGLLASEDGRWRPTGDLSRVALPSTIAALLAARLDRLSADERRVLEAASVIGKQFFLGAVRELVPEDLRADVLSHLMALVRKELVRPDRSTLPGEDAFRFRHLLIRDVAYEAMPKELRAELHELAASWLQRVAGERIAEQQEVVGYHLDQAYRYRTELGPVDGRATRLAQNAARALASAGRRAYVRGDMNATVKLLGRAASLLPVDDVERIEVLPALAGALGETGRGEEAVRLLDAGLDIVGHVGDARSRAHLVLARRNLSPDDENWSQLAEREARNAIQVFEAAGDGLGLTTAWRMVGFAEWGRGNVGAATAAWQRSAELSRRSGDRSGEAHDLAWTLIAMLFGDVPTVHALERALDALDRVEDVPAAKAEVLWVVASLHAFSGSIGKAREAFDASVQIDRGLGRDSTAARFGPQVAEIIERMAGAPQERLRVLTEGVEACKRVTGSLDPFLASLLAVALAELHHDEQAWSLTEAAFAVMGGFDAHIRPHLMAARALVLAHQTRFDEAERSARDAVANWRRTEFRLLLPDALITLGEVLRLAGRASEAEEAAREALGLYEKKGILPLADRARSLLAEIRGG
jgi:class 3 adenylate cyclase/tetratricopeptide (TPR) repeat protein